MDKLLCEPLRGTLEEQRSLSHPRGQPGAPSQEMFKRRQRHIVPDWLDGTPDGDAVDAGCRMRDAANGSTGSHASRPARRRPAIPRIAHSPRCQELGLHAAGTKSDGA